MVQLTHKDKSTRELLMSTRHSKNGTINHNNNGNNNNIDNHDTGKTAFRPQVSLIKISFVQVQLQL